MIIKYLKWDSTFFGKRIGKMDVSILDSKQSILQTLDSSISDYDLLYLYCPENYFFPDKIGLKLVDRKVVYCGKIVQNEIEINPNIQLYKRKNPDPDLINLAIVSAQYSRYKIDDHFDAEDYKRLYTRWMENSINRKIADVVLCYYECNRIIGMITLQIKNQNGIIGLLAVKSSTQNKGIGTQLINAAKDYLSKKGVTYIEVATQIDNLKACRLYERNNLKQISIINIYHFWS